jgi:hypothetical protein
MVPTEKAAKSRAAHLGKVPKDKPVKACTSILEGK